MVAEVTDVTASNMMHKNSVLSEKYPLNKLF